MTARARTPEEIEQRLQAEWQRKLQIALLRGGGAPIPTIGNHYQLQIDGWDVHELYTVLVEPMGEEGCCAGCTELPPGWCAACDTNREQRKQRQAETPQPPKKGQH